MAMFCSHVVQRSAAAVSRHVAVVGQRAEFRAHRPSAARQRTAGAAARLVRSDARRRQALLLHLHPGFHLVHVRHDQPLLVPSLREQVLHVVSTITGASESF